MRLTSCALATALLILPISAGAVAAVPSEPQIQKTQSRLKQAATETNTATASKTHHKAKSTPSTQSRNVGLASWYGGQHHGLRTASGEAFDKDGLTAAHRSLPMNSRLKVTNLRNGRSVIVTVNDRGPHRRDRLIDVSEAAARELGFKGDGIARVEIAEIE